MHTAVRNFCSYCCFILSCCNLSINAAISYQRIPHFLLLLQAMASDMVNVKIRINNSIYTVKMSAGCLTEVLIQGLSSPMVQTILRGTPESIIAGTFSNAVEVLSAINQSDTSQSNQPAEGAMEFEVNIILKYVCFHLFSTQCKQSNVPSFMIDYCCSTSRTG